MGFRRQARRLSQKHGEDLRSNFVGSVEFDDKMLADKPSYSNPISLDAKMFGTQSGCTRFLATRNARAANSNLLRMSVHAIRCCAS